MLVSGTIFLLLAIVFYVQSRGYAKKAVAEEDLQISEAMGKKAKQLRIFSIGSLVVSLVFLGAWAFLMTL